jgi:hypothetical protein
MGGVTECRYCGADNVVGLDLRPMVGPARAEQATLEAALQKRSSEKTKWAILSGVAVIALLVWGAATAAYLVHVVIEAVAEPPKPTVTAPVAPTRAPPAASTPPAATATAPASKSAAPVKTSPTPSKTATPPKGTTTPTKK